MLGTLLGPGAPGAAQAAGPGALTPDEEAYLEGRGPIRFLHNVASAPLSFANETGGGLGIVPDFRRIMELRLGLQFQVVGARNGTDLIGKMLAGEAEVAGSVAASPQRAARLHFTETYMVLETWVWGPSSADLLRQAGFEGSPVAVVGRSTQEATARRAYPNATLVGVPSTRAALLAVANGTAAAMVGSLPVVAYENAKNPEFQAFGPLGAPLDAVEIAFSVQRQDPVLSGIVEKALRSITPEERRAIFVKWTGHDLSPRQPAPPSPVPLLRNLLVAALALSAVLSGGWLASHLRAQARLRRTLAERELRTLTEMNDFKTRFINSLAHELKTPITPMAVQVHLLKQSPDLLEEARHAVTVVDRNLGRLALLVSNAVDVAKLQAQDLGLARRILGAGDLVEQAVARLRPRAQAKRVRLDVRAAGNPPVEVDPERLGQALDNLLSNAIKFTAPGGSVTAEVVADADSVGLRVTDTGVGFAPEQGARLFQPFTKLHPEFEGVVPGAGLGLYLSQAVVKLHGGALTASSPGPGQGATFEIRLPHALPRPA